MQSFLLKLSLICIIAVVIVIVFGEHLYPFYEHFGDPVEIYGSLFQYLLLIIVGALALVLVKTVLGLFFIVLTIAILFVLIYTGVISFTSLF